MASCNTCNEIVSSTCLKWQGKDFSFSPSLQNKRDFESILLKLDEEVQGLKESTTYSIDPKGVVETKTSIGDYVQALIDEVGKLKNSPQTIPTFTLNLEGTGIVHAGNTTVSYEEAMILIIQELVNLQTKIGNTNTLGYIPNV